MSFSTFAPWAVLLGYMFVTWLAVPGRVSTAQFYSGESAAGKPPGVWLLAASAAISWIFAKSIVNSSNLAYAYGLALCTTGYLVGAALGAREGRLAAARG